MHARHQATWSMQTSPRQKLCRLTLTRHFQKLSILDVWQETGCSQRCVDIHVQRGTTSQHHPVGLRMMQTPTDLKGHETPAQTVCCGQSLNFDSRSKLLQQQSSKKLLTVRSSGSGNPYSCQCTKPQTLTISKNRSMRKDLLMLL